MPLNEGEYNISVNNSNSVQFFYPEFIIENVSVNCFVHVYFTMSRTPRLSKKWLSLGTGTSACSCEAMGCTIQTSKKADNCILFRLTWIKTGDVFLQ